MHLAATPFVWWGNVKCACMTPPQSIVCCYEFKLDLGVCMALSRTRRYPPKTEIGLKGIDGGSPVSRSIPAKQSIHIDSAAIQCYI